MSKEIKNYDKGLKETILSRLEPPSNEKVPEIAEEFGIPRSTIYQWVRATKKKDERFTKLDKSKWSSEDKFQVVLETASLSEIELGEYCRRKGIYVEDVKAWRNHCAKANSPSAEDPQRLKEELKIEKEKSKQLASELRNKEKALAETAALLVLRKKAHAIWGDPEEE